MAVKASASITLSRVNDGATGPAGVGIKSVDVEYYLSTSNTAQTGGSWSTTAPTWTDGKYMWSRTKTVTTDNQTKYSNPACITGGKGNTGSTGTGITSITEEYYLSTSKTTQTGGSWVATPPTWSPGKYMWTRSKIVYKNPTSTAYTTPICDSSWEAVNEIEVGGRNYVLNSAFLKGSEHWTLASTNKTNVDTDVKFEGCNTLHINLSGNSSNVWSGANQREVISNPAKGDYYTVSFMYLVKDKSKLDSGFTVELKGVSSTGASVGIGGYRVIHASEIIDNMWGRYTYTFELKTENVVSLNAFPWVMKNGEVWITQVKIERGKTATSWSPNPEDIEERVKDAEQKIEPDRIIATVEEQVNKNGSTVLATRSFVEQTAEQVKYEFESSANNLITNSLFPNTDTTGWTWWTASKFGNTSYFKEGDMWIANTSTTSHGLFYQTYATSINHNTTYTLSIAAQAEGNVNMEGTKIRIAFKAEETNINSSISILDLPIVWDFKRRSYTFKVPNDSNIKYAMLIIRHGGLKPGTSGGYLVRINRPCLMQGTVAPYQPSANELISAKTIINRDGVTVVEGAIRVKNKAGSIVFQGDQNGNLVANNLTVVGLTATNATINGSITVSSNNHQIFRVDTSDTKYPFMVIDTYGPYLSQLMVATDYAGYVAQKAVDGVEIRNNKLTIYGSGETMFAQGSIRVSTGVLTDKFATGSLTDLVDGAPWQGMGMTNVRSSSGNLYQVAGYHGLRLRSADRLIDINPFSNIRVVGSVDLNGELNVKDQLIKIHAQYPYLGFFNSSGVRQGYVGYGNGAGNALYIVNEASGYVNVQGHLNPTSSNTFWLGTNSPDRKWKGVCAEGGVVGASDIRAKENVTRLDGTIVKYDEVNNEILEFQLLNLSPSDHSRAIDRDYYEFMKDRFTPSYYNYKHDPILTSDGEFSIAPEEEIDMLRNVGFIAQDYDLETDPVAREFIIKHYDTGELSYNHMSYVTVGMIALQVATRKIETLESTNAQLQNKVSELELRMKILEDLILSTKI